MKKIKQRFGSNVVVNNKKARFEFELIDTYEAGLILQGSEIKSIREGKVSIQEAHCYFEKEEIFIKSMNISTYEEASRENHVPDRTRKLLLHKSELQKLNVKSAEKGLTIIPTRLFINSRGFAKIKIALARGKKLHDKRQSIKERESKRELDRLKLK